MTNGTEHYDFYEHLTDYFNYIDRAPSSAFSVSKYLG